MNRQRVAFLASLAVLLAAGVAGAQNPNYTLSMVGPSSVAEGANFTADVELDVGGTSNVAGWSLGACNDPTFIVCTALPANGSTLATIKNGGLPDFNEKSFFPNGFTHGVVICFIGCSPLPPGQNYEILVASYNAVLETPTTTQIQFCDTLGTPPVATVIVVNGQSILPVETPLDVEVLGIPSPAYTYIAPDQTVGYSPTTGQFNFVADIVIDQDANGAPDAASQGFSMGLQHDGAQLAVTSVTPTLPFSPDFAEDALLANGWTIGVVYSFVGAQTLVLQNSSVIDAAYSNAAGAPLAGNQTGITTNLTWNNGLGTPPVANVVVVGGASLNPTFDDGVITLDPVTTVEFRRADSNFDGIINIADGIWILNDLFQNGPTTTTQCEEANDANGDGLIDSSDATYIFLHQFMSGPNPPAPYPDCGTFPGQQPAPADCASYPAC
jgi:hypothetical protein